ncbi:MAG: hypothetical protein IPH75_13280 [bacterium]|nr:hypothetical protein [bacterium]
MNRHLAFFLLLFLVISSSLVEAADSTSIVKVGVTLRSRIETTDYATNLGFNTSHFPISGTSYYRQRTGLMVQVMPIPKYELGIRLTNEFRRYFAPTGTKRTYDEVVFDQLYVKGDSIGGLPLAATIGRQNITLGEGFLFAEGGPLDGSRTAYFNAVNLAWQFSAKSTMRVIFANQQKDDDILPVIHDQHKGLTEGDEKSALVYFNTSLGTIKLEPYLMQMERNASSKLPHAGIGCIGLRAQAPITPQITITGELAKQFGDWGDQDHTALGGYGYFECKTNWPLYFPSIFTVGGVYLTGDDESTAKHEGWDPLFGRWPKWSESYVYTLTNETGVAYWSNFASLFLKTSAPIGSDLIATMEYHYLMADECPTQAMRWSYSVFADAVGTSRGDLTIMKLSYRIKPRLTGHILYEHFDPESFYADFAKSSSWMRMEVMLTF